MVMIEVTVTIDASINKVWELFVDLSRWREWNSVLAALSSGAGERIMQGKSFTFLIRSLAFVGPLKPLAEEVLPLKRIILTGSRFGIRARHEFSFEGNEAHTALVSRETFTGITPALPGWRFTQWGLKELTRHMLRDLKTAAENLP